MIMQRWIAAGVMTMLLLAGGGVWAYRVYQQNRPCPMWVPLPINAGTSMEKCDEMVKKIQDGLSRRELLAAVSRDLGLTGKWQLASDDEGAAELGKRLFVKMGEADSPLGKVPSINIGMTGKAKDKDFTGAIVMRLMDDVWKILGIRPPAKTDL